MPKKKEKIKDGLKTKELQEVLAKIPASSFKRRIPEEFFRGVYSAMYFMRNDMLESSDLKKQKEGAEFFIELLHDKDMIIALQVLDAGSSHGGDKARKTALKWALDVENKQVKKKRVSGVSNIVRTTQEPD